MYQITLQRQLATKPFTPCALDLKTWIITALRHKKRKGAVVIRLVTPAEMQHLNYTYKGKNKPTNVLTFPVTLPKTIQQQLPLPILGDIIICPNIVNLEATLQNKKRRAHWQHIVIHGTLHLVGYDHQTDNEAAIMEAKEIKLLKLLGVNNPYFVN